MCWIPLGRRQSRPVLRAGPPLHRAVGFESQRKPTAWLPPPPKHKGEASGFSFVFRRRWDSNPRCAYHAYTLSKRAPSAARTLLRKKRKGYPLRFLFTTY